MDNNQFHQPQPFGETQPAYSQPQQNYGATQPAGAGQPQGQAYGQPQQNYGATQPAYGQSQQAYNNTGAAYGQSAGGYNPYGGTQGYGQQTGGYNPYGQAQGGMYGYGQQPMQGAGIQKLKKLASGAGGIKNEFLSNYRRMGISLYVLLGIIGAMLLIVTPFMNFGTIHVGVKVKMNEYMLDEVEDIVEEIAYDYYRSIKGLDYDEAEELSEKATVDSGTLKLKAADGLNLFELSKASGTVSRVFGIQNVLHKGDVADALGDAFDDAQRELDSMSSYMEGVSVSGSPLKEAKGLAMLMLNGRFMLLITPWVLILCGLGLLIMTVNQNKILKLVFAGVPLVFLLILMIIARSFFAMMGIGALALILGSGLGIASALLEKRAYAGY